MCPPKKPADKLGAKSNKKLEIVFVCSIFFDLTTAKSINSFEL